MLKAGESRGSNFSKRSRVSRVLTIGRSNSGKTNLLAALDRAITRRNMTLPTSPKITVFPQCQYLRSVWNKVELLVNTSDNPIHATPPIDEPEIEFLLSRRRRGLKGWLLPQRKTKFSTIEGPGGQMLPDFQISDDDDSEEETSDAASEFRKKFLSFARDSNHLLVCLDASTQASNDALAFFTGFNELVWHICDEQQTLPFERVVFVLMRADKYFYDCGMGTRAHNHALSDDPWERFREIVPVGGAAGKLAQFCRDDVAFGCCWSSAYGFIAGEGTANYDPQTGGLRLWGTTTPLHNSWRPFQVADPYIYLATGEQGAVSVVDLPKFIGKLQD